MVWEVHDGVQLTDPLAGLRPPNPTQPAGREHPKIGSGGPRSTPPAGVEILIGYARVSTGGQKLDRQLGALATAGCRRVLADKRSGKDDLRPDLKACHAFLAAGDTLVLPTPDRYGHCACPQTSLERSGPHRTRWCTPG
ncbi:recombinase family protein [Streptomyces collinus]|uniref:recombinase family protein n=1 Tax=Streptomyces collinus TaxID=42684 RepID=UPI0036CB7B8F